MGSMHHFFEVTFPSLKRHLFFPIYYIICEQSIVRILNICCLISSTASMIWECLKLIPVVFIWFQSCSEIEDTILLALKSPEVYDDIARGTRCKFETNRPRAVLFEGPPGMDTWLDHLIQKSHGYFQQLYRSNFYFSHYPNPICIDDIFPWKHPKRHPQSINSQYLKW